jgi:hypothetical protein
MVGAPGVVAGVTADEAVEAEPVPTSFTAETLNVYPVPLVSPVNVKLVVALPTSRVVSPVTPEAAELPSLANTETE